MGMRRLIIRWIGVGLLFVGVAQAEMEDIIVSELASASESLVFQNRLIEPWMSRLQVLIGDLRSQQVFIDEDEVYQILSAALLEWIDPDGAVLSPERGALIEARRRGRVFDPGFPLRVTDEYLRVGPLRDDVPTATRDAVEEGWRIVRIADREVRTTGLYQAHELLRSDVQEPVSIVFRNAENVLITQRLARVETILPDIEWVDALPFQMGYLKVNRLRSGTGAQVATLLGEWADAGLYGVVLDLRSADGDDFDSVQVIAGSFAEENSFLFAYRDRDHQDLMVVHSGPGRVLGMPVMILVNAQTRGAAEVLAAVLEDSVRGAMLFGQPTAGDLLLRSRVTLSSGPELYLATRKLVTGGGTVYDGSHGVIPDVVTAEADAAYRSARSGRTARIDEEVEQEKLYHRVRGDATLRRAIDVLLGLKALDIRPYGTTSHTPR